MTVTQDNHNTESPQEVVEQITKTVRVYIRPSDGDQPFLAVAYDLNIASPGDTPKEAFDNLCSDVSDAVDAAFEFGGPEAVKTFLLRGPNAASRRDYRRFRLMVAICHAILWPILPALPLARYIARHGAKSFERGLERGMEKKAGIREYSLPAYKLCYA